MTLSPELRQIVKNELANDPFGRGYWSIMERYAQSDNDNLIWEIMELLNDHSHAVEKYRVPMESIELFLASLPEDGHFKDTQIIPILLSRIPEAAPGVVENLNDFLAEDLLNFLNFYGPEAMLYAFGNPSYTPEELVIFENAVRCVLNYLVSNEGQIYVRYKINYNKQIPAPINRIFENIENAPNAVSWDDIHEIVEEIVGL